MTRLTNSKAAARALAAAEGITYAQALARVRDGATAPAASYPLLDSDWAGAFVHGYTDDMASNFFSDVFDTTGISMVCVWDYYDEYGFGGDSQWYIVERDENGAHLYEMAGDLWEWLFEPVADHTIADHGDPALWKGVKADFGDNPPQEWDGDNWPFESREDDSEDSEDEIDLDGLTGQCDHCETKYVPASTDDHCGECGNCFDHCECEGGPNPHVRAILDEDLSEGYCGGCGMLPATEPGSGCEQCDDRLYGRGDYVGMGTLPAPTDAPEPALECDECGMPYFLTDTEVAHHIDRETKDGIDYDADADHVPYMTTEVEPARGAIKVLDAQGYPVIEGAEGVEGAERDGFDGDDPQHCYNCGKNYSFAFDDMCPSCTSLVFGQAD